MHPRSRKIEEVYTACSLGTLTSAELWDRCAVDGDDEEYCARHQLTPGTGDLLAELTSGGCHVLALTNDVSEWSRLLRSRFGLTRWVPDWVVSGDIGVRKPDPRACAALVQAACAAPSAIHFFDDRTGNVEAARAAGLRGHHFSSWADVRTVVGSTHRLTLAEQRRIAQ